VSKINDEGVWMATEIDKSRNSGKADKQKILERFNIQ